MNLKQKLNIFKCKKDFCSKLTKNIYKKQLKEPEKPTLYSILEYGYPESKCINNYVIHRFKRTIERVDSYSQYT